MTLTLLLSCESTMLPSHILKRIGAAEVSRNCCESSLDGRLPKPFPYMAAGRRE